MDVRNVITGIQARYLDGSIGPSEMMEELEMAGFDAQATETILDAEAIKISQQQNEEGDNMRKEILQAESHILGHLGERVLASLDEAQPYMLLKNTLTTISPDGNLTSLILVVMAPVDQEMEPD